VEAKVVTTGSVRRTGPGPSGPARGCWHVKKPQEGMSIDRKDNRRGSLRLRGATLRSNEASGSSGAWVDARLWAYCLARAKSKARGRRQVATPAASALDRPWRGEKSSRSCARDGARAIAREQHAEVRGFEVEFCGKGTAMVAKQASYDARVPRPRGGSFGGSSGGQAERRSNDLRTSVRDNEAQNPKNGTDRSDASREVARGETRQSCRNSRGANGRGWGPGALRHRESGLSMVGGRCARLETLKGKGTP
jgi:hypothetical protein